MMIGSWFAVGRLRECAGEKKFCDEDPMKIRKFHESFQISNENSECDHSSLSYRVKTKISQKPSRICWNPMEPTRVKRHTSRQNQQIRGSRILLDFDSS